MLASILSPLQIAARRTKWNEKKYTWEDPRDNDDFVSIFSHRAGGGSWWEYLTFNYPKDDIWSPMALGDCASSEDAAISELVDAMVEIKYHARYYRNGGSGWENRYADFPTSIQAERARSLIKELGKDFISFAFEREPLYKWLERDCSSQGEENA